MFLGEASYRPRTGLVQASYRPRTGAFYRRLEKRRRLRRLRRLFSPWRLKVSTALVQNLNIVLHPLALVDHLDLGDVDHLGALIITKCVTPNTRCVPTKGINTKESRELRGPVGSASSVL